MKHFYEMVEETFGGSSMSEEEELYLLLLNAPEQYENDDEMAEYFSKHPNMSVRELVEYWDRITPDGLPPTISMEELDEY